MKSLFATALLCLVALSAFHNQKEISKAVGLKSPIKDIKDFKRTNQVEVEKRKEQDLKQAKSSDSEAKVQKPIISKTKIEVKRDYPYISKKIKEHKFWKEFSDYSLLSEEIIMNDKIDKKELISLSKLVINNIKGCISDFCGIKSENSRGYFDPSRTEAHDLLERSLSILSVLSEEQSSDLDQAVLNDLMKIENENIQSLSLELSLNGNVTDQDFSELVEKSKVFLGPSKAASFVTLQKESLISNDRRKIYLDELKNTLAMDGLHGIETAKKLNFLKLKQKEVDHIAKGACLLKRRPANNHNWKAVKFHVENYAEGRGLNVNWQSLCK